MTRSAYQVLYTSAVTFAMRKQQQAEHGRAELEQTIDEEEKLRTKQRNRIIELEQRIAAIKKRCQERDQVEKAKREEEMKFLKFQSEHLANFFKAMEER